MGKCLPEFEYFTVFLKNKNIIFKIRRSKVTDYAALTAERVNRLRHRDAIISYNMWHYYRILTYATYLFYQMRHQIM